MLDRGAHQAPLGPRVLEEGSDREGKGPVRHEGHLIRTGTDPGSHGLPGRVAEQCRPTALAVEPRWVRPAGVSGHGPRLPGRRIEGLPGRGIEESSRRGGVGHACDATRRKAARQVVAPPGCEGIPRALGSLAWSDGAAFC